MATLLIIKTVNMFTQTKIREFSFLQMLNERKTTELQLKKTYLCSRN